MDADKSALQIYFKPDDLQKEINAKLKGIRDLLIEFRDSEAELLNEVASQTIFNGGKPGLNKITGTTAQEGFQQKKFKKFRKTASSVSVVYWSHITNIFENYKERKQLRLVSRLAKEFKKYSKVDAIFNKTLEDYGDLGSKKI